MNEMQVFKNSEFGELGVLQIDGKEYFPATACAKALGYKNHRDALIRHCKMEGVVKHDVGVETGLKADGTPAMQTVNKKFISVGNLFRLITHSKLPSAEKFERWVFDEVLPTIRKQGSYSASNANPSIEFISQIITATVTEVFKQLIPAIVDIVRTVVHDEIKAVIPYDQTPSQFNDTNPLPILKTEPYVEKQKCKIETFPLHIINEVDKMFCEMQTQQALNFSMISRFCTMNGYSVSSPSVKRYFDKHFAS